MLLRIYLQKLQSVFRSLSILLAEYLILNEVFCCGVHCVKIVLIRSCSFSAFGLNTERYSLCLRIQSQCGKMRTRVTANMGTFYAVAIQTNCKCLSRHLKSGKYVALGEFDYRVSSHDIVVSKTMDNKSVIIISSF